MGRSHSKASKSPVIIINERAPLSPKQKFRKDHEKKKRHEKQKKTFSGFRRWHSKLSDLKEPEPLILPNRNKISDNDPDVEAKCVMQDQLAFNSDIFVLNQMMMSVQFFADFERDLLDAVELNRKRENEKSFQLMKHCKTILMPDRLHEAVDRRVKYMAKHGKYKSQLQPLHTQTLYIVHDNIEITNPGDTSVYSILSDAPLYKLQIDDPYEGTRKKRVLHHVGYVKLKSSEKISKNDVLNYDLSSDSQYVSGSLKNEDEDEDADCEDDDGLEIESNFLRNKFRDSIRYARNVNTIYDRKMNDCYSANGVPLSTASTNSISPASSEYDYTYITALHTHQPLSMIRRSALMENPLSTVMLPDTCISNVSRFMINNKKQEQFYSAGYSSDDESEGNNQKDEESDYYGSQKSSYYYEDKQYLNSKEFLSYFINLFQQTLANELGISQETLKNATWKGSAVYCAPWEIIPAISCPWPREANEWIYRQRELRDAPLTMNKVQWPTAEMISKIISFGCHVTPQGYAPKLGTNPQRELEWKIIFPEAERYLESRLSSGQAKVFMITKVLIKAFVEPNLENGLNMFTTEHIRAHLFWQCEYDYTVWDEDHLGEALIRFLGSLLHCIKTHRLPDYFLPKRNLLENVPEKVLVDIHKRIYRIVESPIPYVLIAIRNLRYQRDFYPKLKYKRLYSRLVVDDPKKIANPRLEEVDINALVVAPSDDEDKEAPLGSIAYFERKERRSRRRRTRCVRFALDEQYVAAYSRKKEIEKEMRRVSVESIDTKVKVRFMKHMEIVRRKLVYEIFIDHFIEMAKVSIKYRSLQQTMGLLKQANRMCLLLVDDQFIEEADKHRMTIEPLKRTVQKMIDDASKGPELPRRVSIIDKETIKLRFKPGMTTLPYQVSNTNINDVSSDDDNDEIYSYHKSIIAQIHATSEENLARFQHADEADDDIETVNNVFKTLEIQMDHLDDMHDSATKM